jgi:PAS domain S-box-containing protein
MREYTAESTAEVVVDLTEKKQIRVLHVDDESGFLKVAKQCLETEDQMQVDTASSVEEAMEKMKNRVYDVIVSDYQMPAKDGLEFLKELRHRGDTIPFIMFTGKGREEVAINALNLGADQYLNKTGNPETVYGELAHAIRQAADRKSAQERMKEAEERYRTLFEEAMDAFFVADAETGVLIDCNRAATELVGRSKSELIGKHQQILHPPQEIIEGGFSKTFQQHVKEKGGQVLETQIITKRGEIKEVAIKASLIELGGKKVLQGMFRDVTEDKLAKEALRKSSEEARSLLEFQNKVIDTAIVWIDLLDREGNVTLWNRAAEIISGYSREEVVGHKNIWEWLYPDPEYRAEIFAHAKKTIEYKELAMQDFETVIRCKDGMTKTISWYANNIVDEKGGPVGSIAMGTDVTELREAERELKTAMERLGIMNEKLRVVGGLTRHDVRNKLSVISGNAYLAKKELVGNSKVQNYLREMEVAVGQVVRIFDFAKAYEMLGVEELAYVDVERTVGEAVSLFSDLKGVKVANDCQGLSVLADSLLRQLFYNLVDNSLKYGQKTTRIRIHYEEANQDELKLVYEDDGVGIPAAEEPKLFKEGYSTGGSTGYGLYLIGKIVEIYGWTIRETGTSGKGAEFTMTIPKKGLKGKENYQIR